MDSDEWHLSAHPSGEWVTHHVIEAVSRAKDVEPARLEPPLYDAIDPDSLQTLLNSTDEDAAVTFHYQELAITVCADGQISLAEIGTKA